MSGQETLIQNQIISTRFKNGFKILSFHIRVRKRRTSRYVHIR